MLLVRTWFSVIVESRFTQWAVMLLAVVVIKLSGYDTPRELGMALLVCIVLTITVLWAMVLAGRGMYLDLFTWLGILDSYLVAVTFVVFMCYVVSFQNVM